MVPKSAPSRLTSSPQKQVAHGPSGLHNLGIAGRRDGLVLIPRDYDDANPAPLIVALHGAGGAALGAVSQLREVAQEKGIILVAPESRARTWDVIVGGYGPDVTFIDKALGRTFERYAVDPSHLAIGGFSDGASYALSLGLSNGDLFSHIIAFSPGFSTPLETRGSPRVFVSHGVDDQVLPIDATSRRIVPTLRRRYDVRYEEFDGGHTLPEAMAREAMAWFLQDRA